MPNGSTFFSWSPAQAASAGDKFLNPALETQIALLDGNWEQVITGVRLILRLKFEKMLFDFDKAKKAASESRKKEGSSALVVSSNSKESFFCRVNI
jgi:hypothetical protein